MGGFPKWLCYNIKPGNIPWVTPEQKIRSLKENTDFQGQLVPRIVPAQKQSL